MEYPIFQSIINKINDSLRKRNIDILTFKTWEESKINAAGLEIFIDLKNSTHHLKSLSINFDWDRFREASLARRLDGTDNHPVLQSETFSETNVEPVIDIEVTWHFREDRCQPQDTNGDTNYRIQTASEWMDHASRRVNELLQTDDIITRWHIQVDGDENGKYLSAINLISYFQYSLSELNSLGDVHQFVDRKLIHLLYRSKRVVEIVDHTVNVHAA